MTEEQRPPTVSASGDPTIERLLEEHLGSLRTSLRLRAGAGIRARLGHSEATANGRPPSSSRGAAALLRRKDLDPPRRPAAFQGRGE